MHKMNNISKALGFSFDKILSELYIDKELSGIEISDYLFDKTKIRISARAIQARLKFLGIIRPKKESFRLAIRKGRLSYEKLRKTVKSRELRKGISLKLRYEIFKRDDFKCVLCGATAQDDLLMIDHIKPVVKGGLNECENLRTLCRQCNLGKMISEHEK